MSDADSKSTSSSTQRTRVPNVDWTPQGEEKTAAVVVIIIALCSFEFRKIYQIAMNYKYLQSI